MFAPGAMPIPPTWNQGFRPIPPEGGIACMGGWKFVYKKNKVLQILQEAIK